MVGRAAFLLIVIATFPLITSGQSSITEYNNGSVRARILAGGRIGAIPTTGSSGYTVPLGLQNVSPLYTSGLWFSGTTSTGETRCSAHLYGQQQDFSTGPLSADGNASWNTNVAQEYDRFWNFYGSQMEAHDLYFNCLEDPNCDIAVQYPDGYAVPDMFYSWPALGDPVQNQAPYLAPFLDRNNDGYYDPMDGDRPCLPGDQSIFHIFNDHTQGQTGGTPLGLEIHMTTFGYQLAGPEIGQTLFVKYRIINQTTTTYNYFRIGVFADFDLGCYTDDRVGTDVERNLCYVYNSTNDDVTCATPGYGPQPPAFGLQIVQGPLLYPDGEDNIDTPSIPAFNGSGFNDGTIDNERYGLTGSMYYDGTAPGGDPMTEVEYTRYMSSRWPDAYPLTYSGTGFQGNPNLTAEFAFPGSSDPDGVGTEGVPQPTWNDASAGDRKSIAIIGPMTMEPGEEKELLLAYVFAQATSGGPQGSVAALRAVADQVNAFAASAGLLEPVEPCASFLTGVSSPNRIQDRINVYPNPVHDDLSIRIPLNYTKAELIIEDPRGAVLMRKLLTGPTATIDVSELPNGVYVVRLRDDDHSAVTRFVKQ